MRIETLLYKHAYGLLVLYKDKVKKNPIPGFEVW